MTQAPRHFLTLQDLSSAELNTILDNAEELKRLRGESAHPCNLSGKSVILLFEKASTRTRISFETGIHELGGKSITLLGKDIQLGRGESIEDTARMFSRYAHAVMFRTSTHDRLETLANMSSIPVINGLTDRCHPCQLLADLMTVREAFGADLQSRKVAWIGDGNNMSYSWMQAAALLGFSLHIASPTNYTLAPADVAQARAQNPKIVVDQDISAALKDADVVTTDVWASMGQEDETQLRQEAFKDYCVDQNRMAQAKDSAIFLHCLPAHRDEEVTAEVIDGPQSRVWVQAENRLHAQKALLFWLFHQCQ